MTIRPIRYHVEIGPVREVSLLGTADLAFWRARLGEEGLQPIDSAGKAQVLIVGVDARFKGIAFRELSISVLARELDNDSPHSGALLVQAFNSIRFFAFVERAFFHTPYLPAQLVVDAKKPAGLQVAWQHSEVLRTQMAPQTSHPRQPASDTESGWRGAIYLPSPAGTAADRRRLFFGKLIGRTQTYPFAADDVIEIRPNRDIPILQCLVDSQFTPSEWQIRPAATHGKSKTIRRGAAYDLLPDALAVSTSNAL